MALDDTTDYFATDDEFEEYEEDLDTRRDRYAAENLKELPELFELLPQVLPQITAFYRAHCAYHLGAESEKDALRALRRLEAHTVTRALVGDPPSGQSASADLVNWMTVEYLARRMLYAFHHIMTALIEAMEDDSNTRYSLEKEMAFRNEEIEDTL